MIQLRVKANNGTLILGYAIWKVTSLLLDDYFVPLMDQFLTEDGYSLVFDLLGTGDARVCIGGQHTKI